MQFDGHNIIILQYISTITQYIPHISLLDAIISSHITDLITMLLSWWQFDAKVTNFADEWIFLCSIYQILILYVLKCQLLMLWFIKSMTLPTKQCYWVHVMYSIVVSPIVIGECENEFKLHRKDRTSWMCRYFANLNIPDKSEINLYLTSLQRVKMKGHLTYKKFIINFIITYYFILSQ